MPYADRKKNLACMKEYRGRPENREKQDAYIRNWFLGKKYGITHDEYAALLEKQGGVCAICGGPPSGVSKKHYHVDHDHETGKIRGLLCSKCNTAVGLLGDSADGLRKALNYLEPRDA